MSLYRCSVCGSPNVTCESRLSGIKYDYAKGAMGSVILGPGGAAAGITSTTETIYKCADCGAALPYPMADHIKAWIDLGVISLEARKTMEMDFIYWDGLTAQYKNIEKGPADEAIEKAKQLDEANKQAKKQPKKAKVGSIEWEMALDFSSDEGKAYLRENYKKVEDKLVPCKAAIKAKGSDNYEKWKWRYDTLIQKGSFQWTVKKKKEQIEQLGTISIFNRRKRDALQQELNCARDEYNRLEELIKIKLKEWDVKPLEDYGPSCINDSDNSFIKKLHRAFLDAESKDLEHFLSSHDYIAKATIALSIFYGLGRTHMTGKQLRDAMDYYVPRLLQNRNPLFLPQLEAIEERFRDPNFQRVRCATPDEYYLRKRSKNIVIGLHSYGFTCGLFALLIANDSPTFTNPLILPSGKVYIYHDDKSGMPIDFGPTGRDGECKRRDEAILRVNNIWKP